MEAKAEYERFDVEISYVCPKCGVKSYCSLDEGDVGWLEGSYIAGECAGCGADLKLTK